MVSITKNGKAIDRVLRGESPYFESRIVLENTEYLDGEYSKIPTFICSGFYGKKILDRLKVFSDFIPIKESIHLEYEKTASAAFSD